MRPGPLLRRALIAFALCLAWSASSTAALSWHTVGSGHTLGKIAKRYNVSLEALCLANDIPKNAPIKPGLRLIIPDRKDADGSAARRARRNAEHARKMSEASRATGATTAPSKSAADESEASRARATSDELHTLEVPGSTAYYYEPTGRGRLALRPVIMYLHGRGGDAASECRRWAQVARPMGWLLCPSGPEVRATGHGWDNNWPSGRRIVMAALAALREKHGRRVQLYGNTIVGFSEGAYVAMNVGVREARAFNRWLILAASDQYWGVEGHEALAQNRGALRRVYLITGKEDTTIDGTLQVKDWLRRAGVPVRTATPDDMGHVVALDRKRAMYHSALVWLEGGKG